jgi:conjugal transfer/entry exclusion protein
MKRVIYSVLAVPFFFYACSTTSFLGLSKAKYVAEMEQQTQDQIQQVQRRVEEAEAVSQSDVERIEAEMSRLTGLADQMESLIADLAETNQTNEELQVLTAELQVRVDALSKETLRELITVLDDYLMMAEAELEEEAASDEAAMGADPEAADTAENKAPAEE